MFVHDNGNAGFLSKELRRIVGLNGDDAVDGLAVQTIFLSGEFLAVLREYRVAVTHCALTGEATAEGLLLLFFIM
jgi:hypothetical protein